jgi:hypothetical protein
MFTAPYIQVDIVAFSFLSVKSIRLMLKMSLSLY